ncbi:MAG: hypothetical protein MUF42_08845 [Cytophagaceae bacterium]|nr:hypothetical protein [Cytophagaceae bacterium]
MRYFWMILIPILLFSCKKKKEEVVNDDYQFYPLQQGSWYIYQVDVTKYQGTPQGKDSSYQLKEVLTEPLTVNDETRYQVYRYYRSNETEAWDDQPDSVWTVFLRGNQLVRSEDNERFVKLSFPIEVDKSWNGNSMNTKGEEIYRYQNVRRSFKSVSNSFASTVTVMHADEDDIIQKDKRWEVFAKDIGLVHKEKAMYKYDQSSGNIGKRIINVGEYYKQYLIEYGK